MKIEKIVKVFSFCAVGLLFAPGWGAAGQLEVNSHSSLAFFERDTKTDNSLSLIPFYEYLGVNYVSDVEGLSFHGYGWGRVNFGDDNYYQDESDGEILYGYLKYSLDKANASMMLGRQQLFSGVANASLDGLSMQAALGANFNISLYGGLPVALEDEEGISGDSILGGRISNYRSGLYELGVSYKLVRNDSSDNEEKLGLDVSLNLPHSIGVNGFSTWNLLTDDWAEHSYEMQLQAGSFQVRPFLQLFQYDNYFSNSKESPNPFKFLAGTGEELTIIGAEVDWFGTETYEVNLKAKNIDYDLSGDASQYFSGTLIKHLEDMCQVGLELGVMAGDTSFNDYLIGRAFVYWDRLPEAFPLEFVSTDLVFVNYREDIYGQSNSTFISLGSGKTFFDKALAMKFSLDYSKDPYFDNDFSVKLVAEYTFRKE